MDFVYYVLIGILIVWDAVWKGIALWRAVSNRKLVWFICLFIFNTVGILPIIYLYFFDRKKPLQPIPPSILPSR